MKILGTGRGLPQKKITNDELAEFVDTNDEWITTRTGISSRRVCETEVLSDLAYKAAVNALEMAETKAEELDMVICTTVCGDYLSPSLACVLNKKLGAKCPSFDVNAACPGFIYGLDVAESYFRSGRVKKVLLVSAEKMSKLVDWNDRSTCVLFGDGAGAVVLGEGEGLMSIHLTAEGNDEILNIPTKKGNSPFDKSMDYTKEQDFMYMNGKEVYKFAVSSVCRDLEKVMVDAGITEEDVSHVLLHQANMRIIAGAQKRFSIPTEKYLHNIERTGNTSSASIPILLDEELRGGRLQRGEILLMSAFGGGLTTGACALKL